MREIKFRVWNPAGTFVDVYRQGENFPLKYFCNVGKLLCQPPFIWTQYTGLKDKNGKEIYEGDIASVDTERSDRARYNNSRHEVVFEEGMFGIKDSASGHIVKLIGWATFEVIGNIYEHPELLNNVNN